MSYRIHITTAAERDMNRAADYIEFVLKNPQAADDFLNEAEKQLGALGQFPEKFPLVDDRLLASWGIRFVQVKNHLAFYVISEELQRVIVVRFLYGKSNWISVLKSGVSLF